MPGVAAAQAVVFDSNGLKVGRVGCHVVNHAEGAQGGPADEQGHSAFDDGNPEHECVSADGHGGDQCELAVVRPAGAKLVELGLLDYLVA